MCGNLTEQVPDKNVLWEVTGWLTGWMGYRHQSKIKWQFILDPYKKYSRNKLSDLVFNALTSNHDHGETEIPLPSLGLCFIKAEEPWFVQMRWYQSYFLFFHPPTWRLVTQLVFMFWASTWLSFEVYQLVLWNFTPKNGSCGSLSVWDTPEYIMPTAGCVIKDALDYQSNLLCLLFLVIWCYKEGKNFIYFFAPVGEKFLCFHYHRSFSCQLQIQLSCLLPVVMGADWRNYWCWSWKQADESQIKQIKETLWSSWEQVTSYLNSGVKGKLTLLESPTFLVQPNLAVFFQVVAFVAYHI